MPTIDVKVQETYSSMTRPIGLGIVKSIVAMTGLPIDRVSFSGLLGKEKDIASLIGTGLGDHSLFRTGSDTKIEVSLSEKFDENYLINTPVHQSDALAIFQDKAISTLLRPIYSRMIATIEVKIRTADYALAQGWINDQKIKYTQGRNEHSHDIEYHYPVPTECLVILKHLHSLRESQAGYNQSWDEWLSKNLSKKATVLTTMAGKSNLLAIKETAVNILGWWEFTDPPENQKSEVGATREISFTYKYQYDQPTHVSMIYPISVHNQMLDMKYVGPEEFTRYGWLEGDKSLTHRVDDVFRKQYMHLDFKLGGVRIPHFDEWYPTKVPLATTTLALALCQILPTDLRTILDLNDLKSFGARDEILSFISKHHDQVFIDNANPFILTLYKNGVPVSYEHLEMGTDLVVKSKYDLDLRSVYHLRLGLLNDLTLLSSTGLDAMRTSPVLCHEILNRLDATLLSRNLLPKVLNDRIISKPAMISVVKETNRYYPKTQKALEHVNPRIAFMLVTLENKDAII